MAHKAVGKHRRTSVKQSRVQKSREKTHTKQKNKIKWFLTSNQDDDAASHGNAGFARLVVASAVGALHSHAGYAQAGHRYDNTDNHEGAGCLEGTWVGGQERVKPSVTATNISHLTVSARGQGCGRTLLEQNKKTKKKAIMSTLICGDNTSIKSPIFNFALCAFQRHRLEKSGVNKHCSCTTERLLSLVSRCRSL